MGSRDGAVVRAVAYHQCGLGLTSGPDARHMRYEFVLVVGYRPCPKGFSPSSPQFSSLHKNSKFHSDMETVDEEPLRENTTANSHFPSYCKASEAPTGEEVLPYMGYVGIRG